MEAIVRLYSNTENEISNFLKHFCNKLDSNLDIDYCQFDESRSRMAKKVPKPN